MMTDQTEASVNSAAETTKDAIDKAAAWAHKGTAAGNVSERIESAAESAKRAVDTTAGAVKDTAGFVRDAAQRTTGQATDAARDVYQRSQQLGAEIARQTQEQPATALLIALSAGVLIGFSLAMALKSR